MDIGQGIWAHNVLAHASHEAARFAIVRGADSMSPATAGDIETFLRSRTTFLDSDSVNVTATWTPNNSPGGTVEITATYTFQPLISMFVPDIPLSSTAQMVMTN